MTRNQICVYDWTWFLSCDENMTKEKIIGILKATCKKWCFQLEAAPTTGNLHYQGRLSLGNKKRHAEAVAMFNEMGWPYVGLSPTSDVNRNNCFYVMKPETRVEGPWKDDDEEVYVPLQYRGMTWYPWQQAIIDDSVYDTRSINVIFDEKGNIGKSTLVGWLGSNKLARMIPPLNDYKDLMRMVMDMPTSNKYLIDMPRAIDQRRLNGMYSAVEEIKNGHAWDDRYRYAEKWFDSPSIWVFTNTLPDQRFLTADRWKVWKVVDRELVRVGRSTPQAGTPIAPGAPLLVTQSLAGLNLNEN